jgi:hypothetical protein
MNLAFFIPIHIDISLKTVFSLEKWSFRQKSLFIFSNSYFTDIAGFVLNWHFDSLENYEKIIKALRMLIFKIKKNKKNIFRLGILFHTLQDFYAHSNYVDLYIEYCIENNKTVEQIENIPFFEISKFDETFVENYLKKELFTGQFNFIKFILGTDTKFAHKKGIKHHNEIAKDYKKMGKTYVFKEKEFNTFDLAFNAAKSHTEFLINNLGS